MFILPALKRMRAIANGVRVADSTNSPILFESDHLQTIVSGSGTQEWNYSSLEDSLWNPRSREWRHTTR